MKPWPGSSVDFSVFPVCWGWRFDFWLWCVQESTDGCMDGWNHKSVFLFLPPPPQKSINKNLKKTQKTKKQNESKNLEMKNRYLVKVISVFEYYSEGVIFN